MGDDAAFTVEEKIRNSIVHFVQNSTANRMFHLDGTPFFEEPLVGFSDGRDPLFEQYKEIIGDYHFTPAEIMERALRAGDNAPNQELDSISVVSYILPVNEKIRKTNRAQRHHPSLQWAHGRNCGERFNDAVRDHVVMEIREMGYLAVAPMRMEGFKYILEDGPDGIVSSNWSERHAAYVAGLGTFSLSDGFITPKGIAMRCGNIVTNLPLQPTERTYPDHYNNCLYYREGSCKICIERCPVGAITEAGHDKQKCRWYLADYLGPMLKTRYNVDWTTGCGLCQTAVPCEQSIPPSQKT
jgi:epoxyqueuosine reductase QueG